jgi:acyl-CoA-binding protein
MTKHGLHTTFEEAFKRVSQTQQEFPPDVLLKFYSLYKQATQEQRFSSQDGEHELVSAFKMNALLQVKHLSSDEAKEAYIALSKKYLK